MSKFVKKLSLYIHLSFLFNSGLQCLANTSRNIDDTSCNCPNDCNSITYSKEISTEQLYPLYSQTFNLLGNTNNYLWKLEEQLKSATDSYEQKLLRDRYDDVIESSSVVHFYFKESGILKYSQEEVFATTDHIGRYFTYISYYSLIYLYSLL